MIADIINASFEALAGVAIYGHVRRLRIDKQVKGASSWATVFFTAWGFWNLYYYPSLGQWASTIGGISVVSMNAWWLALMWKYRGNC